MNYKLKYSQYNERSILVEWPAIIDENILESILNFKNSIKKKYIKERVYINNTYNSILIIYDSTIDKFNDRCLELKSIFETQELKVKCKSSIWEIPICYDREFGIDLDEFSKEKNLTNSEVIKLHTDNIYTVFFIGFLPGFLYLGGLDSRLYLDRKIAPNLNVKKGSIAIGGQQTGIYPKDSPGGWHIIGKTPIELFDSSKKPPCFIKAGDKVRFTPVNKSEYKRIEKCVLENSYQLEPTLLDA